MKKICTEAFMMAVALLLPFLIGSCQDDLLYDADGNVIEGQPATVSLKFDFSGMDAQTRALIDDAGANYIGNVWVGIYQKSSGECLFSKIFTDITNNIFEHGTKYAIPEEIQAKSGECYIVGAANVTAVDVLPSPTSTATPVKLGKLLTTKDANGKYPDWNAFKQVCALRSSKDDIHLLSYSIPMSGHYVGDDAQAAEDGDIPTVKILAGNNELKGAIELRRLIAYNKFNIMASDGITLELVSWQVCNNPYYTYVLDNDSNAGDLVAGSTSVSPYNPSLVSTTFETQFNDDKDVTAHSFEFYQFENKRDALSGSITGTTEKECYNQREAEYKNSDKSNSGIYKSLVSSIDATDKSNNNASYVILKAKLSYYYDNNEDPKATTPLPTKGANTVKRTAEATYVIHLGYCEGSTPAAKASDFNCRRNTRYTYNVTIKGVDNIVVEAYEDGDDDNHNENQPGVEGTVYDTNGDFYELDSHYNVFNIGLSNVERASLTYYITAPYNGQTTDIATDDIVNGKCSKTDPFYTWIKFRKTSDKNVLAKYADTTDGLTEDNLWSLEDLRDVAGHPGSNGSTDATDTTTQYYTVFIDEYVYHFDDDGSGAETSWQRYTNQDNRIVELATLAKRSNDTESQYLSGKYAFSQRSIQTYFDYSTSTATRAAVNQTGMGVEHTNESYGLNFCWDTAEKTVSYYNGRYNLQHATANSTVVGQWSKCVDMTTPEHIVEATKSMSGGLNNPIPELYPPVPKLYLMSGYKARGTRPNPNSTEVFSVNTACMNRNRDLNGNGVIDQDEIRWFLPTYNQYVEIMIGRSGLVSPLIDWYEWPNTRYSDVGSTGTEGHQNFYYASSDCGYIETDEGFSKVPFNPSGSLFIYNGDGYAYHPSDIRCVRYLGTNPATASASDSSDANTAYERVDGTNKVQSLYFNAESLRPYVSTFLAPHTVASELNRPYNSFEMAENHCTNISGTYLSVSSTGNVSNMNAAGRATYAQLSNMWYQSAAINELCGKYTQEEDGSDLGEWRLPNYAETAMMFTLGMLTDSKLPSCTHEYFKNFTEYDYYNKYAFFGKKDSALSRSVLSNGSGVYVYVRCVRDVR